MSSREKIAYEIAYYRSTGKEMRKIFKILARKITCEILDVMIENGFTSKYITSKIVEEISYNDRECLMRIADMMHKGKNKNFDDFIACCEENAPEIALKYRNKSTIPMFDLETKIQIPKTKEEIGELYISALIAKKYAIADMLLQKAPSIAAKELFWEENLYHLDVKTLPLDHFLLIDESLTHTFLKPICEHNRMDLLTASTINPKYFFSEFFGYNNLSIEIYRYCRTKAKPSYEAICRLLMGSSYVLLDDEYFAEQLEKHFIVFFGFASSCPAMCDFIIEKYRDQISAAIDNGKLMWPEMFHLNVSRREYQPYNCMAAFIRCLIIYDFPQEKLTKYWIQKKDLYGRLINFVDFGKIPNIHPDDLPEKLRPILYLHQHKSGIREWATRLMAMVVMYSDGYFRVRHKNNQRFFEFVRQLPLALQSIIAFRYAWLPNCETILLRDSDFYRELAGQ